MYNIRTSPLDASLKREQVIRNREVIAVSEPCFPCVCCNKTVMRPRYEVIKRDESKAMQEAVATPALQLAVVEQVDFSCVPKVGNAAYNDPASYGGYSPYNQRRGK